MNALEQIERQLSESVAARTHDDTPGSAREALTARHARAATARPPLLRRRPVHSRSPACLAWSACRRTDEFRRGAGRDAGGGGCA